MHLVPVKNYCPCCGYPHLERSSYHSLGSPPWRHPGLPPYEHWYGEPSYEVCPCCGFEFGNDDNPGTSSPISFEQYRQKWSEGGFQWFDPSRRPEDWDLQHQLMAVGIKG